jgi:hypothetical protein
MTLISRINCGTHILLASDCQVNTHDHFKQVGKSACKSREIPGSKGFIGIAGVIQENGIDILNETIDQLKLIINVTIHDCTQAIDQVLNQIFGSNHGWDCVFMISLISKGVQENLTYLRSPKLTQLVHTHIIAHQINSFYLEDLNKSWGNFDYNSLWSSEIFKYNQGRTWVTNVDFNWDYMHFFDGLAIEDPAEWDLFTKPYTLLYYEFLNRGLSYQNFQSIKDGEWIDIFKSMYDNAHRTYSVLYKDRQHESRPCSTIGECNHIIKLDVTNQKTKELLAEFPCN